MQREKTKKIPIDQLSKIHQNKYDYSKAIYTGWNSKIEIICPEHGSFWQKLDSHKKGHGCILCSRSKNPPPNRARKQENVVKELTKIHQDRYDYSKIQYKNMTSKVEIICPEHGSFFQTPNQHRKRGCPKCFYSSRRNNIYDLIKKFKRKNPNYIYPENQKYQNTYSKIEIICPEHGSFHQRTINHLYLNQGCPRCNSSKGENYIRNYLLENSFSVLEQYSFRELPNLRFDFYLEDYNLAIEYDGIQHFEAIEHFGGEEAFASGKERDEIKNKYCKDNNIYLLRIPYWEYDNIEKLLQEKIEYIYIKEYKNENR
jgi:protein-arginine kinase activator protein McsA/very-short-patch-repair endonuclease